jgi:hypothetical protein
MGILDIFKKSKKKGPELLSDLTLSDLEVGYLVDYDMKTWEVSAHNYYEWGEGDISHEWQLKSADEVVYLEKESDDEDEWSLNRKIPFNRLGSEIREKIIESGDPPDEIVFEDISYFLEEMSGGQFHANSHSPGKELLRWSYEDDEGRRYLGIEQWGEEDFDASVGEPVEEYQFTNILPRELS